MTMGDVTSVLEEHLEGLSSDYYDLAFPGPFKLAEAPSSIEALRMVGKGHPTVIKGFSPIKEGVQQDWHKADTYTLIQGDKPITIAITDDGLADSVRIMPDGQTSFVKPYEAQLSMAEFLQRLRNADENHALYLQSQDGNIARSEPGARGEPELASFQQYIRLDVPWMRDATGGPAEAVNLWIGSSKSTTSFHHDPYENVYHVLSGSKTFTLLSPIEGLNLDQRFHPPSTLVRTEDGELEPKLDAAPAHAVPWVQRLEVPNTVRPITITLQEGETLYLPADWWHKVEQSEGRCGLAVAVNYWYPAELRPERYALLRFAQRVANTAGRSGVVGPPEDGDMPDVFDSDSDVTSADEWDPSEWGR